MMATIHQTVDGLSLNGVVEGNRPICYFLSPFDLAASDVAAWSNRYGCDLVVITGMDWDNDLTPWPAPGVPRSCPPFKGLAPELLRTIENEVIPAVEVVAPTARNLCGVSLSGLFATWAWMHDDTFDNIGSISGSFWYDGFLEWLKTHIVVKPGFAFFSLGNQEGGRGGYPKFRDIQTQTRLVVDMLHEAGISDEFRPTQGNHFANPVPRIEMMLDALMKKGSRRATSPSGA